MTEELNKNTSEAATTGAPAAAAPAAGFSRGEDRRGPRKPSRDRRDTREPRVKPEFDQKIISIRRVTRVVTGGRRFSFSVAVVVGQL